MLRENCILKKKVSLIVMSVTEEERLFAIQEHAEKVRRDYNAIIEDNYQEGIREAEQEIAKNMLSDGVDINLIAKYTKLSVDEIKRLS